MTGAYLRQKRGDKFEAIEVEHLTPGERREHLAGRTMDEVMRWMDLVCAELVESETFLNELERDGILKKAVE